MKKEEPTIYPFITFCHQAESAIQFYTNTFPNSKLISITYVTEEDRGVKGDVLNATFELSGNTFMAMDMEEQYYPTPAWSISFLFNCSSEDEFNTLFNALSDGGNVLMGPESIETEQINIYKCAWVTDKYKVTWQLVYQ